MIKRKSGLESSKEEKQRKPRQKRLKIDLSKLEDAVIDRKLMSSLGEKVYFERTLDGRSTTIHEGFIKHTSEDGSVEIWDETREQLFCFNLNQEIPKIKRG